MSLSALESVTYCQRYKRANIHTIGCNFKCKGCSYKLIKKESRGKILSAEEVKSALKTLDIKRVHFVGGEPTICEDIASIAKFCHEEINVRTKIGHSTGINMPPENIDEMHITIKAFSDDIHREYTGVSNSKVLSNFKKIYDQGIFLSASTVFIPELVDIEEIEKIAKFIAGVDPAIPFHITGYIPVPGTPWRSPYQSEMIKAKQIAGRYLEKVTTSRFQSIDDYNNMIKQNPSYQSVSVL